MITVDDQMSKHRLANKPDAVNPAVALRFAIEGQWCRVTDPGRRKMMRNLIIINGIVILDGGSIRLEANDSKGNLISIELNWSIEAQEEGTTFLSVDGVRVQPGSIEEMEWIEALRCAEIGGPEDPLTVTPPPLNRVVFGADLKGIFKAFDRGPRSGLSALRDDLLQKIESPAHRLQEGSIRRVKPNESGRSGPLPLP